MFFELCHSYGRECFFCHKKNCDKPAKSVQGGFKVVAIHLFCQILHFDTDFVINTNFDLQNISRTSSFQGCYDALKAEIDSYSTPVIGVGITILVIEVGIAVISPSVHQSVRLSQASLQFFILCFIIVIFNEHYMNIKRYTIMFHEFAVSYDLIFIR